MKKKKMSFDQLFKENKEEIMRDKLQLEKIERRLDAKYEKGKTL